MSAQQSASDEPLDPTNPSTWIHEPPGTDEARRKRQEKQKSNGNDASASLRLLRVINPTNLEFEPVQEREWIVPHWLPIDGVTANYGDGGVGKTLLAQQLMTACATKTAWCGLAVKPCRSFGLFCEDDEAELHRRQVRICEHLDIGLARLDDMRWVSGLGQDNTFAVFTANGRMHTTERYEAIESAVKDHKARLVVFDTAADLFAGNENDRQHVRQFIGLLNHLRLEINGAVLLNAHPSRDAMKTGLLDGGSTMWNNGVRSRWSLARPGAKPDAADQPDTDQRILTRRKSNYASTGETIPLRWVRRVYRSRKGRTATNRRSILHGICRSERWDG
jgi:RecA-family ATPase